MTTKEMSALTRLVKLLNSGTEFYREAQHDVPDQDLATIFEAMAFARETSLAELQPFITASEGEQERGRAPGAQLRKHYTNFLAALRADPKHIYIGQLEEIEKQTLESIDEAMRLAKSRSLLEALTETRDRMSACNEKLHELEHTMA